MNVFRNTVPPGMCGTERMQVSATGDAMLDTRKSLKPVKVTAADIRSYLSAARVTEELQEYRRDVPQPVEYVKSAPYSLSFLDHYKLKRELKNNGFSKILVLYPWTMAPRMIATLISDEAERRTIGTPTRVDKGTGYLSTSFSTLPLSIPFLTFFCFTAVIKLTGTPSPCQP